MSSSFVCPSCHKSLKVPANAVGKRAKCPACAAPIRIPVTARTQAAKPDLEELAASFLSQEDQTAPGQKKRAVEPRTATPTPRWPASGDANHKWTAQELKTTADQPVEQYFRAADPEAGGSSKKVLLTAAALAGIIVLAGGFFAYRSHVASEAEREARQASEQLAALRQQQEEQRKQAAIAAQQESALQVQKDAKIKQIARLMAQLDDKSQRDLYEVERQRVNAEGRARMSADIFAGRVTAGYPTLPPYVSKEEELYNSCLQKVRRESGSATLAEMDEVIRRLTKSLEERLRQERETQQQMERARLREADFLERFTTAAKAQGWTIKKAEAAGIGGLEVTYNITVSDPKWGEADISHEYSPSTEKQRTSVWVRGLDFASHDPTFPQRISGISLSRHFCAFLPDSALAPFDGQNFALFAADKEALDRQKNVWEGKVKELVSLVQQSW